MNISIDHNYINRPYANDKTVAEMRTRRNAQPLKDEKCPCGKNKNYHKCCGKNKKVKWIETVVRFQSNPNTKLHNIVLAPQGVFVYADGSPVKFIASEIQTYYERSKSPKITCRIFTSNSLPLITFDNIFNRFDALYAIDTNTVSLHGVSVCAVTSIIPDFTGRPKPFIVNPSTGEGLSGSVPGNTYLEGIFMFKAGEYAPENLGWHVLIQAITRSERYRRGKRFALVVDSDLGNLEKYNSSALPYFLHFKLPNNIELVYASADRSFKNINLLNFSIYQCDSLATTFMVDEKERVKSFSPKESSSAIPVIDFQALGNNSIFQYFHE